MKHILPDFKYEIKNILTNKKLKKKNYNIKIYKVYIFYNIFNNKYYIKYI